MNLARGDGGEGGSIFNISTHEFFGPVIYLQFGSTESQGRTCFKFHVSHDKIMSP